MFGQVGFHLLPNEENILGALEEVSKLIREWVSAKGLRRNWSLSFFLHILERRKRER